MRVLVTGAFGFAGYAVTRRLLADGHEVLALTSRSPAPAWTGPSGVEVLRADIRDRNMLRHRGVVGDVDAVCHLAALTRVRDSFDRPEEYSSTNTLGTLNLLALLAETKRAVPFVQASTAVVYGAPEQQPIAEDAPYAPSSPYAASKVAADQQIQDHTEDGRVAGVSLRIFNMSGAMDGHSDTDLTRIIPKAVAVANGRFDEIAVNGDGTAIRDYVHVADVAQAFALALAAAEPGVFKAFNVGATPASITEIIAVTENVTGRPLPIRHNPPAPEAPELRADTTKIRTDLHWSPKHSSLEEIIGDAWAAEQSKNYGSLERTADILDPADRQ